MWQDAVPRKRSKHSPMTVQKKLVGRPCKRWPTEMEFESDNHKVCPWLRVEKSRKTHFDTRVEGGAEQ